MQEAIKEAKKAYQEGEVPVGAVLCQGARIIARAHNQTEKFHNVLAHAEFLVLEKSFKRLNRWRLSDCHLYTTLEPCVMCAGGLVYARISGITFGAYNLRWGGCYSVWNVGHHHESNHTIPIYSGLLEEECQTLLKQFFQKREKKGLLILVRKQ